MATNTIEDQWMTPEYQCVKTQQNNVHDVYITNLPIFYFLPFSIPHLLVVLRIRKKIYCNICINYIMYVYCKNTHQRYISLTKKSMGKSLWSDAWRVLWTTTPFMTHYDLPINSFGIAKCRTLPKHKMLTKRWGVTFHSRVFLHPLRYIYIYIITCGNLFNIRKEYAPFKIRRNSHFLHLRKRKRRWKLHQGVHTNSPAIVRVYWYRIHLVQLQIKSFKNDYFVLQD